MKAVEFITELSATGVVSIPSEAAAQLPKKGKGRVIVLIDEENNGDEWRSGAYEQFLREAPPRRRDLRLPCSTLAPV